MCIAEGGDEYGHSVEGRRMRAWNKQERLEEKRRLWYGLGMGACKGNGAVLAPISGVPTYYRPYHMLVDIEICSEIYYMGESCMPPIYLCFTKTV